MGIKINKILFLLLGIFISNVSIVSAQKKGHIENLKVFALCSCVNKNYMGIDSTFYSSDVTNSYIFQFEAPLSPDQLWRFNNFITDQTSHIYKEPPYGSYDAPKANMIFYFCMEFYKSKKLDKYIKKLLREKTED